MIVCDSCSKPIPPECRHRLLLLDEPAQSKIITDLGSVDLCTGCRPAFETALKAAVKAARKRGTAAQPGALPAEGSQTTLEDIIARNGK